MILQKKTLERLRDLINEETEYRSGPKLVNFFNDLGFNDIYSQGFPSRWLYTDSKLEIINGKPELDICIKNLFSPVNFIGKFSELDNHINNFNQYLAFDDWKIVRNDKNILFKKADKINFQEKNTLNEENDFLNKEFNDIPLDILNLDSILTETLNLRLIEIKKCLSSNAPLSVIFLTGSTLEGILLGIAIKNPRKFNESKISPKNKDNKVKPFQEWTLNNLIEVAYEQNFLSLDVKRYSHSLRDFRNYIHPYEQMSQSFNPDNHTAKISWQVLKAAIYQLSKNC